MKKIITILALSVGTFYSGAQITLTEANQPRLGDVNYTFLEFTSGITVPMAGANQVFDYTNLPAASGTISETYFNSTRAGLTNYTRYKPLVDVVANIPINLESYTNVDANGYARIASYIEYTNANLLTVTGDANDSLVFPEAIRVYSNPDIVTPFPLTYGDAFSSISAEVSNFELTVNAYGLSQTPGYLKSELSRDGEVIAYGTLTLPMQGGKSIPYDVILVKNQSVIVDSVMLGGAPAPPALMAAFGLTQGNVTMQNSYKFYAEGFETTILFISMDETWTTPIYATFNPSALTLDTGVGTSENELGDNFKVYPNPTSDKITISMEKGDTKNKQIAIYDIFGKQVKDIQLNSTLENSNEIEIDVRNLSNGTYFVKVSSNSESSTKKIIINK